MNYMFGNEEECSSGCESGWTLYLQHSSISRDCYEREDDSPEPRPSKRSNEEEEEEEDEDLSMVSDASSGPPQLHEEEAYGIGNQYSEASLSLSLSNTRTTKNTDKINPCRKKVEKHSSLLDDTASSPLYGFCNKPRSQASMEENVLEYSQGYSSTQFEVRPPYQEEHYDFLQSGNQLQHQNQWYEGKRW